MLFWFGIIKQGLPLSANEIVRCFKLKKLQNYMTYQVDFLHVIHTILGYDSKILLANQLAGFLTLDLFGSLILTPIATLYLSD